MNNTAIKTMIENAPEAVESLPDAVMRLSLLPTLEYEQVREKESGRLNVRISVLDTEVANRRRKPSETTGKLQMFPTVELWPEPVDGAELLNAIYAVVQRFIICEPETAIAATLWIAFTWFADHVQVAPLAIITAPEKRCGKSQLLALTGKMAKRPLMASNISSSAIFRVIEGCSPTLLIDEVDAFLRENEEARGILNSGHTRQSAFVIRNQGDDHEPTQFSTWGPKALCGIGTLADTLMDRAILLELRRKRPHEKVERLRHAEAKLTDRLASQLARWSDDNGAAIGRARPALPEALNDRAQDNWEPLLAIADHAGGDWPDIARKTALKLSGTEQEAVSLSAELLADIRDVFERAKVDRMSTADLLCELVKDDEAPWASYNRGKPMVPRQLAKRLGEYGLRSNTVRIGAVTPKGFLRKDFDDVFARYITPSPDTPLVSATPQQSDKTLYLSNTSPVADNPQRCGKESLSATPNALITKDCCAVADKTPPDWIREDV